MITINLLPDEYRRKATAPLRTMATVGVAAAINAGLIAWWSYLHFGVAKNEKTTQEVLQLDMDALTPQVQYHDNLQAEIGVRSAREKTLSEITKNRVLWTNVLDELIDVVQAGGTGRRKASFGNVKAAGHSGSEAYEQVANFLEDIEDTELSGLMNSFSRPADLEAKKNDPEEDLIPSVNWSFPLELELKSPDERIAAQAAREEESK